MMQGYNNTISLKQLISLMNRAKHWEMRDGFLNAVIVGSGSGKTFEESINEIQSDFVNRQIIIKTANDLDKNGNLPINSKTIKFIMPPIDNEGEESYFDIMQPMQQRQQNGVLLYGLGSNLKNQNQQFDLAGYLGEFENRLRNEFKNDFDRQVFEIQKQRELEKIDEEKERLNELRKQLEDAKFEANAQKILYEEKLNKVVPDIADILKGLGSLGIDAVKKMINPKISTLGDTEKDVKNDTQDEPEKTKKTFKINPVNKDDIEIEIDKISEIKNLLNSLPSEVKEEIVESFLNDLPDDEQEETEQEFKET